MTTEDNPVQVVRCIHMEPTNTKGQITTHTPTRSLDTTPPDEPPPTWQWPYKQMEASNGTTSVPLGVTPAQRETGTTCKKIQDMQ